MLVREKYHYYKKAVVLGNNVKQYYSANNGVDRYLSPESGSNATIVLPLFSGLAARICAAFNAAPELLFKKAAPKTKAGFKEIDVKFYIPISM